MNVIGHEHVSPDTDTKLACAPAIFDEGLVHFGRGEHRARVCVLNVTKYTGALER